MTRILMATQVNPDARDAYIAMHRDPDPAVASALLAHGHYDFRLHLLGGYAISSFEYVGSDLMADRAAMRALPELSNWMQRTSACQSALTDEPNAPMWRRLPQIFPVIDQTNP